MAEACSWQSCCLGKACAFACDQRAKFHTSGGPRHRPCLGKGRGRRIPYRIGWEKKIWQNIFCMMLQCELTSISQRSFKRTWADNGRYIIHHDTRIESVLLFIQKITPHDSGKTRADISESESYKSGMWRIVCASACCYAWLRGAS